MTDIRPMTLGDLDVVVAVVRAANADSDARAGRAPATYSEAQQNQFRAGMRRFVERDGPGAWVAVDGDAVVGMAEAIRRDSFWGCRCSSSTRHSRTRDSAGDSWTPR